MTQAIANVVNYNQINNCLLNHYYYLKKLRLQAQWSMSTKQETCRNMPVLIFVLRTHTDPELK